MKVTLVAAAVAASAAWTAAGQPRAASARLVYPNGLALDAQGALLISDIGAHQVFKLTPDGQLTVIAGTGDGGFSGDGGAAAQAKLFAPHDITFDADGSLLIADSLNHRVRRVEGSGIITTIAGTGKSEYGGDGGPATAASLNGPQDLTLDRDGNLLVADTYNHVVRRIDRSGVITAFAGPGPGLSGDGGPATRAQISIPMAVTAAADGVYISDAGNSRIRRVAADGTIQTIAGSGLGSGLAGSGFGGDDGPAEKSKLFSVTGLHANASGHLYISDSGNNRVRVIRDGAISTLAGTGVNGFSGDGGKASGAVLNTPQKVVVAPDGRVYIADRANGRVRMIDADGVIRTVAGDGAPRGIIVSPTGGAR